MHVPVGVGFGAVAVSGQWLESVDTGLAGAAVGMVGADVVEVEVPAGSGAVGEVSVGLRRSTARRMGAGIS